MVRRNDTFGRIPLDVVPRIAVDYNPALPRISMNLPSGPKIISNVLSVVVL